MDEPKHAIPAISVDAQLLYATLKEVEIGETIGYPALDAVVDRDVRNGAAGVLQTARRRCLNLDQIVFGTVRSVGLKRLGDTEIVDTGQGQLDSIRRRSRRAFKTLTCVASFDDLPAESKVRHNTFASMFNVLANITKPGQVKKLEKDIAEARQQLPLARTLESFKG